MLFSSPIFIYLFLPLTLLAYYLVRKEYRNNLLLFASLVFFAWGGVSYTSLIIVSILFNYFIGILLQKAVDRDKGYGWLFFGVAVNILLLGIFKYANFIILNLNDLFRSIHLPLLHQSSFLLPIGISFYTFHSLSYLVDIYRWKSRAQRNVFDMSLYITMFSQLIAGPIIRYSDVSHQLRGRTHTLDKFGYGIERFIIGLAKKVLLANTFAAIADAVFQSNVHEIGAWNAWLGIICYSLQIYYDFSGYSDMAIGLGRMFGFEFLENFNFPYISRSVKEFWRRWHISLSSFFRDYVYIPLGGNKGKPWRTYVNLILVFFLTGFWHGASWSFVVWGLFHGFFMILERLGFEKLLAKVWGPVANLYTVLVVVFAWVLFRAETMTLALDYWKAMFDFHSTESQLQIFYSHLTRDFYLALGFGIAGALGLFSKIGTFVDTVRLSGKSSSAVFGYVYDTLSVLFFTLVMIFCTVLLISGTYNPFIYYRF